MKRYLFLGICLSLTACGGGGGGDIVPNYSAIKQFGDGSGIARGAASKGDQKAVMYMFTPDVLEVVASANATGSDPGPDFDPQDFPLVSQLAGYDFRQGNLEGANVTIVSKPINDSGVDNVVLYFEYQGEKMIMSMSDGLVGMPEGQMTYGGLYSVEDSRYPDWFEIGDVTLIANFENRSFSIDAVSETTRLSGDGFLDVGSGQISSVDLLLNDFGMNTSSNSSILGGVGGNNASGVTGIWYSNESTPIYKGAIIGNKQ